MRIGEVAFDDADDRRVNHRTNQCHAFGSLDPHRVRATDHGGVGEGDHDVITIHRPVVNGLAGNDETVGESRVERGEVAKFHGWARRVNGLLRIMLRLPMLLAVLILLAVTSPAYAKQQVTFWTMQLSPFHDAYVRGVIADFEIAHPDIAVKWVDIAWAEAERKTLTAIAAKTAPDVVNLNPQFASKLAEFAALADPELYLSPDEIAQYLPGAWRANRMNGKTFALPWYLSTNVLVYNTEIFARTGVGVPTTADEFLAAARAIKTRTGNFAYFPSLDGSIPLETMVAMGGNIVSPDRCSKGQIGANGASILGFHQTLYQEKLVPRNLQSVMLGKSTVPEALKNIDATWLASRGCAP